MNKDNLWITRIQLQGNYWDAALYSGLLYLWRTPRRLHIYHWRRWQNTVPLHEMPIYLSKLPVQLLNVSIGDLQPYFYKEITFSKDVRDSFVYHHRLYFLDEEGLFSLEPESAKPRRRLLVKGNFPFLTLSTRNRLILCAGNKGVFEYPLSQGYRFPDTSPRLQHWSSKPAQRAEWAGQDLVTYDEKDQPVGLLRFQIIRGRMQLVEERPFFDHRKFPTFYNEELDLTTFPTTVRAEYEWGSLFHYPPTFSQQEAPKHLQGVPLERMPNPHFSHPPLEESQLYLQEQEDGLHVLFGPEPLLHFSKEDYRKWRTYSKSRHYQHHLHLLQADSLTMLLFFQNK